MFIINNFILKSTFLGLWKIACINPIPKIVNLSQLEQYKPISNSTNQFQTSKISLKLVLQQMAEFLEKQLVYDKYQSGYRKSHLTTTLSMKLYDDIKRSMYNIEITIAIFADYSKAFVTINFYTVIQKIHSFNFSTACFTYSSTLLTSEFGVPQVSILVSIFFSLCVTDLLQVTPETIKRKHLKI